jgi:endogenous inhibitor of DNA gyrase (YacG/DUF329 family)
MSRPPTRQLTLQFVLRTFKRVDMIAARYSAEAIAKALIERGADLGCPAEYLRDIWEYMRDLKREAGVDIHAHPNGNCPQCGHDIGRDHNGARYCSNRCKQRAYRLRLNKPPDATKRIKRAVRDASHVMADRTNVTQ